MPRGLLGRLQQVFDGDGAAVRQVANDPALTAELLLLFRMILADGEVSDRELATFRRICRDAFGIEGGGLTRVLEYLQDFGYEITVSQAIMVFPRIRQGAPHHSRPPHGRDRQGG